MSAQSIFDFGTWSAAIQSADKSAISYFNGNGLTYGYSSNPIIVDANTTLQLTVDNFGVVTLSATYNGEASPLTAGIALSLFPEFDLAPEQPDHLQVTQIAFAPEVTNPFASSLAEFIAGQEIALVPGTHGNWTPDPVDLGEIVGGAPDQFGNSPDGIILQTGSVGPAIVSSQIISMLPQVVTPASPPPSPPPPPAFTCDEPIIEVWQPPAAAYNLRIRAYAQTPAFAADTDTTTADSRLVFLMALANLKAHYGQPDASAIANQLQLRLRKLKARNHNDQRYVRRGDWTPPPQPIISNPTEFD